MPSPNDRGSPLETLIFMAKIVNSILNNKRPSETGSQRMKQIGVMNIIYTMSKNGDVVTVTKLCERLDTPRQVVVDVLKALVERGLLSFKTEVHESGRGRVYVYALTEKALTL